MNSIKKFKLSNIVAVFVVLLFLATAIALFASNAYATEKSIEGTNDVNYDLTCDVNDHSSRDPKPVPDVPVKFFNNDGVYVSEAKTDSTGKCYFNNLPEADAAGTLLLAETGRSNVRESVTLSQYNPEHKAEIELWYTPSQPNFSINSNDENHMFFNFTEYRVSGETVLNTFKFNSQSFTERRGFDSCVATYQVKNNGTLNVTPHNFENIVIISNVEPLAKEGFELDY